VLYGKVTSPDMIARMEGGDCWFCGNTRDICPGCTGGVAEEFYCFMGCGVDLACPNCMGVEFALRDKEYLEKYYDKEPPESKLLARRARWDARLKELGYPLRTWDDGDAYESP